MSSKWHSQENENQQSLAKYDDFGVWKPQKRKCTGYIKNGVILFV